MADHPIHPDLRLLDGAFYAGDPHPLWRWMRDHAPVYRDPESGVWGIGRYDDLTAVSREPATFSNADGIRPDAPPMPFMINLDGRLHRKRRNLVNRGFTLRAVHEREPRIREVAVSLLERARELGRFDFVREVSAWLPLIVIGDMLGVEAADYPALLRWSEDMVLGTGARTLERMERAKPPAPDLVSVLVHAEIDGERLDDEEIVMECLLILIGGDETTRHVITGGLYELLLDPAQRRLLERDPTKLPGAVEEMLRWVSPIQNMARTATRDVEIRGQTIREGDKVLLLYPSANRDADVFPAPFSFDVERTPNEHVAFGYGGHFCLGASLARLELRVLFEELFARLPGLDLASAGPPPRRASNFISGIEALPVDVGRPREH